MHQDLIPTPDPSWPSVPTPLGGSKPPLQGRQVWLPGVTCSSQHFPQRLPARSSGPETRRAPHPGGHLETAGGLGVCSLLDKTQRGVRPPETPATWALTPQNVNGLLRKVQGAEVRGGVLSGDWEVPAASLPEDTATRQREEEAGESPLSQERALMSGDREGARSSGPALTKAPAEDPAVEEIASSPSGSSVAHDKKAREAWGAVKGGGRSEANVIFTQPSRGLSLL